MKILLLSPPYVKYYMRNARCDFVSLSKSQWYPIWLGNLGAFLEKHGFEVKLIDAPAAQLDHDATEEMVLEYKPDFLVVYAGRLSEDNDAAFADRLLEKLDIDGVFVGPYVSIEPGRIVGKSKRIYRAVKGEFEYPVLEILQGKPDAAIANLVFRQDDETVCNPERPYLTREELDSIPFVTEFFSRQLDFRHYRTPSEFYPFVDLMTGRGCAWGKCTYCLWVHTFICGNVYNSRSVDNVVEEFQFIERQLPQIKSVMIQDDTLVEKRAREISEGLIKAGIRKKWSCYVRGNIGYETLQVMKRAGCRNLHVGYESASPEILQNIKKGVTRESMIRFSRDAKRAGLRLHGDFAIGFPGETRESVQATIDLACQMRPHTAQFQLMIPFPGTPFYDELAAKGQLKDGCPNYPGLSTEELEEWAKKAYRKYYFSPWFLKEILKHPQEMFFSRFETYMRAIPSIFWKKYVR